MSNTELKLDVTFEQIKPLSVNFGTIIEVPTASENGLIDKSIVQISNDKVTEIGDYVFYSCQNLTNINFPNVTTIGADAFTYCGVLSEAIFPNAVTVKNYAFAYCFNRGSPRTGLKNISFPKVTTLGHAVFGDCELLEEVNLPMVETLGNQVFYTCIKLTTINFPKCKNIGSYCFNGCSHLTTIDILGGGTIDTYAFQHSSQFNALIMRSATMTALSNVNAFNNTKFASGADGGIIYVPEDLIDTYSENTNWKTLIDRPNNQILAIEGSAYEED